MPAQLFDQLLQRAENKSVENFSVAHCEDTRDYFLGEMNCQAVMEILAGVEIAYGGQINEPAEITRQFQERSIPHVFEDWLDVGGYLAEGHNLVAAKTESLPHYSFYPSVQALRDQPPLGVAQSWRGYAPNEERFVR